MDRSIIQHFLLGSSFPSLLRMLWRERDGIDHWGKAAACVAFSGALAPARIIEKTWADRKVARQPITEPPVFVIGHFRSGTTHLHTLLTQDPASGFVPTYLAIFPNLGLTAAPVARRVLAALAPKTRPMDEMPFQADLPQEDEIAIGNLIDHGGFSTLYFPKRAGFHISRHVLFDGATKAEIDAWKQAQDFVIRKATVLWEGRRIVLKNPWNTARIPQLLELYPDAKFIHIRRNPYELYFSALHTIRTLGNLLTFSRFTEADAREHLFSSYRCVMQRYFDTEHLIPDGNLVDVSFEELTAEPWKVLNQIYEGLGLSGYDEAAPLFERYLSGVRGYRKNRYDHPPELIGRIRDEWALTIDRWGYAPPGRP